MSQTPAGEARRYVATLDPGARMPGRGAYLCRDTDADAADTDIDIDIYADTATGTDPDRPAPACLERAVKRRAIARALRRAVTVPEGLVVESPGGRRDRARKRGPAHAKLA